MIVDKWYSVDPKVVEGKPNILEIPRVVFNSLTKYYKVSNGQVVKMTQVEKDAVDAAQIQAEIDVENARISKLDNKMDIDLSGITLIKVDTAIDNIGSLADAKVFLKKLCRYIIKFISVRI